MSVLVDTSEWSLAARRDAEDVGLEVDQLKDGPLGADVVMTTGLVLQELLPEFSGAQSSAQIIERFASLGAAACEATQVMHVGMSHSRSDWPGSVRAR